MDDESIRRWANGGPSRSRHPPRSPQPQHQQAPAAAQALPPPPPGQAWSWNGYQYILVQLGAPAPAVNAPYGGVPYPAGGHNPIAPVPARPIKNSVLVKDALTREGLDPWDRELAPLPELNVPTYPDIGNYDAMEGRPHPESLKALAPLLQDPQARADLAFINQPLTMPGPGVRPADTHRARDEE